MQAYRNTALLLFTLQQKREGIELQCNGKRNVKGDVGNYLNAKGSRAHAASVYQLLKCWFKIP
jgi:hypothetical protein